MHSPTRIIVWGAGGHAKVVADVLRCNGIDIAGFIDDLHPDRNGESFCNSRVFSRLDQVKTADVRHVVIAIGDNRARALKANLALQQGLQLISLVHPRATVAKEVVLGEGTVVMAGAVVQPGSIIGSNVIINTQASVDHDCTIGDSAHICPGARLAGGVSISKLVTIGAGATVIDKIQIAQGTLVGAGAVVVRNVRPNVVVAGIPARIIKKRGSMRDV